MPFTRIFGGFGGPGSIGLGLAQGDALAAEIAASQPSIWGALGAGVSSGIGLGLQNVLQRQRDERLNRYDVARDTRIAERQDARERAYLERIEKQQQAALARQVALEQEQTFQEQYRGSYQSLGQYFAGPGAQDPMLRTAWEDIQNEWLSTFNDANLPALPPEQVEATRRRLMAETIQLAGNIPSPPSPSQMLVEGVVPGRVANDDLERRYGVRPLDESAVYFGTSRNGSIDWKLLERPEPADPAKAAPPTPVPLAELAMKGNPMAQFLLSTGYYSPRDFWNEDPNTKMLAPAKGFERLPPPVEDEREAARQAIQEQERAAAARQDQITKERNRLAAVEKATQSAVAAMGIEPEDEEYAGAYEKEYARQEYRSRRIEIDAELNTAGPAELEEWRQIYERMRLSGYVQPKDRATFDALSERFGNPNANAAGTL